MSQNRSDYEALVEDTAAELNRIYREGIAWDDQEGKPLAKLVTWSLMSEDYRAGWRAVARHVLTIKPMSAFRIGERVVPKPEPSLTSTVIAVFGDEYVIEFDTSYWASGHDWKHGIFTESHLMKAGVTDEYRGWILMKERGYPTVEPEWSK